MSLKLRVTKRQKEQNKILYRLKINEAKYDEKNKKHIFAINDIVKNSEGLTGNIVDLKNDVLFIDWEDKTKERVHLGNEDGYLTYIGEKEIHEDIISKDEAEKELTAASENKDNVVKDISKEHIIEEDQEETIEKIDLEAEKKKQKTIEDKRTQKKKLKKDIKFSAAKDIVDLAIRKGMVDEDDREMEIIKVESFDDESFKIYETEVMEYTLNGDVSSAKIDENKYAHLPEKERTAYEKLDEMKLKRGISTSSNNFNISDADSRNLSDLGSSNKFTYSNIENIKQVDSMDDICNALLNSGETYAAPPLVNHTVEGRVQKEFENSLADIERQLDDMNVSPMNVNQSFNMEKQASVQSQNFLSSPFTGITKPLVMGQKNPTIQTPANSSLADLLGQLDWSSGVRRI